jgi:miniconductance mechanosensitive channel
MMIEKWITALSSLLNSIGLSESLTRFLETSIILTAILLLALLADFLTKKIIVNTLKSYVKKSKNTWDDVFLSNRVFHRLAHIAPALVVYHLIDVAVVSDQLVLIIQKVTIAIIYIISLLVTDSFVNALHIIYQTFPIAQERPINGFIQVIKIFIYCLTIILLIALLSNTPPLKLLAGLGALAAVLLLVFKDTILGLVASIQVSANNMVKPGDWITMPSRNTDGTVLEITLNTVKVQNWDKTISTFPTYALVTESFNNWKGMEESGGRRIKRSINIDMKSVKFLDSELKTRLKKIQLVNEYIDQKEQEINKFNETKKVDPTMPVNGRRMTNLGIFRHYMEAYLKQHPKVSNELTFLVRHLQPTEIGIPLEIYVFSKEQEWAKYEALQADIFDHILAAISYFDLRVFQNPTGDDFQKLTGNK